MTLTATVSPSTATGTVVFYDGSTQLGTAALSNGTASLPLSNLTLTAGTHALTVFYGIYGGTNDSFSTSPVLSQEVLSPSTATTTTLTSSSNPSVFGQSITLTATVGPSGNGNVTFYDGVTALGSGTLSSGRAMLTTILAASGVRSLTARYDGSGAYESSVSASLSETVTALPESGLGVPVSYPSGYSDNATPNVAIADFNGDGRPDLATAGPGDDLIIMLGNGDGTFQTALHVPGTASVGLVSVGDFNQDGHVDLVATSPGLSGFQDSLNIFLGNGDGTFRASVSYPASAAFYSINAATDINGDGWIDIVTGSSAGVNVFFGNGDGTLQPPVASNQSAWVLGLAAGDFNGDGKPDLATANTAGFSILIGKGDGTFQTPVNHTDANSPYSVAVTDFNGDGKADLVVADESAAEIQVLLGNGDGTFQAPIVVNSLPGQTAITVGDFNGDGKPDLAVTSLFNNQTGVLIGNGDGTFQSPVVYNVQLYPYSITAGDLNGDGRTDLITDSDSGGGLDVLLGVGTQAAPVMLSSSANPSIAGQAITLKATVPSSATGTVAFMDASVFHDGSVPVLGTANVSGGVATLTISTLPVASHTLTASYSGDSSHSAGTSPALIQVVNLPPAAAATTAVLTSSLNPGRLGQSVTLTATVTPASAFGNVTFYDGSVILGTSSLSAGRATLTTTLLGTGSHALEALYEGDTVTYKYAAAETPPLTETVSSFPPTGFLFWVPLRALNRLAGSP